MIKVTHCHLIYYKHYIIYTDQEAKEFMRLIRCDVIDLHAKQLIYSKKFSYEEYICIYRLLIILGRHSLCCNQENMENLFIEINK